MNKDIRGKGKDFESEKVKKMFVYVNFFLTSKHASVDFF